MTVEEAKRILKESRSKIDTLIRKNACYQRDVLWGRQLVSGSDLRGTAREYAQKYKWSRESLFAKIEATEDVSFVIARNPARGYMHRLIVAPTGKCWEVAEALGYIV